MLQMINQMLIEMNNFDGLTNDDIEKLPDKWKRIIAQMGCEFINMVKFTQTYIGNMRSYEGDWRDRVTGKITKRRFYDEREWRALKTKKNQSHLIFNWDDITEIILKEKSEWQQLIDFLRDHYKIDLDSTERKIKFISDIVEVG